MQQLNEFIVNHWMLSGALLVILTLLVLNEVVTLLRGAKRLSPGDAVRLINDQNAFVLDVRNAGDYKKGHLLGASNIPTARLADRASELPKDKSRAILCYCALGSSAPAACEKLKKMGYENIYVLHGGLNNWQGASLPVTQKG